MKGLSYANVMSTIAVFGVLGGGGAYAATTIGAGDIKRNAVRAKHINRNAVQARHLGANSVRRRNIRRNAVSATKLADGAVLTSKLADGAVLTSKLADGAVLTSKLADGSVSEANLATGAVTSSKLASGAVDASKLAAGIPRDVEFIEGSSGRSSENKSVVVECPAGKLPIGGGATAPTFGAGGFVALTASSPTLVDPPTSIPDTDSNGWFAQAIEVNGGSNQSWGISVWLICARLGAPTG
jgi:hypothetical protein